MGWTRRVSGLQLKAEILGAYFLSFLCSWGIDLVRVPMGNRRHAQIGSEQI